MATPNMTNHSKRRIMIPLLALTIMVLLSGCGFGFGDAPPPPMPWFTEHVKIEPVNLPTGVGIQVIQQTNHGVTQDILIVTNTSATPLYLAGEPISGDTTFETISVELPTNTGPIFKIVSGQAFSWEPIVDPPDSPVRMGWKPKESFDHPDAAWLHIYGNRILGNSYVIVTLEPKNEFHARRPKNVEIPKAQSVALPLIYGTEIIQVPLTIAYTLNSDYHYYEAVDPVIFCTSLIGILLAVIYGISSVVRKRRRNRLKETEA